jgi:hypothetical protein
MPKAPLERRAAFENDERRVAYCSECGEPTGSPRRKTCSPAHRQARSRRLKAIKKRAAAMTPEQKDIAARIDGSIDDVTHKVVEEEIRPMVREALTQEVFDSIQQMTRLVPPVIQSLQQDLASDDDKVRQKASELVLRYTVGNTAVLKDDPEKHQPLHINFALPRPGGNEELPAIETEAVEYRECDMCHEDKPVSDFVENSLRCVDCFNKQQEHLQELLNAD